MELFALIYLFGGILIGGIGLLLYITFVSPKPVYQGIYSNPRVGRRKIPEVWFPGGRGLLRHVIEEEGDTMVGEKHVTLVLESDGKEIIIPHVLMERDCQPLSMKQFVAGSDNPVLLCCVDTDGIRHPELFDVLAGKDLTHYGARRELIRLATEYAKLRRDFNRASSEEGLYDKLEEVATKITKIRKAMGTREIGFGEEEEEGGGML